MESTTVEINVVSARGLPEINLISKMVVYVVVSLAGDTHQKLRTNVDSTGGINPDWNFPVKFELMSWQPLGSRETLVFTVRCSRNLGDRDVGEVHVLVAELLHSAADWNSMLHVTYPVRKPSGKTQGVLNFEYKFGGKVVGGSTSSFNVEKPAAGAGPPTRGIAYQSPVEWYPPPLAAAGFPPPPQYGGYPLSYPPFNAPQPNSYGYTHNNNPQLPQPPPHYEYYPPVVYPPAPVLVKKEKKSGMGKILAAGAALLGGLVCGVLIGEMAADLGPPSYTGGNGRPSGDVGAYNSTLQSSHSSHTTLGQIG